MLLWQYICKYLSGKKLLIPKKIHFSQTSQKLLNQLNIRYSVSENLETSESSSILFPKVKRSFILSGCYQQQSPFSTDVSQENCCFSSTDYYTVAKCDLSNIGIGWAIRWNQIPSTIIIQLFAQERVALASAPKSQTGGLRGVETYFGYDKISRIFPNAY